MKNVSKHRTLLNMAIYAMFMSGVIASYRTAIAASMRDDLFTPLDPLHATGMIGEVLGAVFAGFAITLVLGSAALTVLGFRRSLFVACGLLTSGMALMVGADSLVAGKTVYYVVIAAALLQGVGWGFLESTVTPLVSALYPEDRTHRISVLHAWYPAGVVCGSMIGLWISSVGSAWRWGIAPIILATFGIALCAALVSFPPVTHGAGQRSSLKDLIGSTIRTPTLLLWMGVMMMTAATEFLPGQWVDIALSKIVGMRGIWLFAYVSGLMFVMRHFAGLLVHRLSNIGLLLLSCVLGGLGLTMLAQANSPFTAFVAATLWGVGICFMWPTMLATVSMRYPNGGPLTYGLLGGAGAGSAYFGLPLLGSLYDSAKIRAAGGAEALASASPADLDRILKAASSVCFYTVAILPAILVVIFGLMLVFGRLAEPKLAYDDL